MRDAFYKITVNLDKADRLTDNEFEAIKSKALQKGFNVSRSGLKIEFYDRRFSAVPQLRAP
jgi:hypothetical protein